MEGSIARKLLRLGWHLSKNPRYLSRYLGHLRSVPLTLGLPWFSYAAIDFLDRWIRPGDEVFEYGSGGSSLFFGRRARAVTSVEDDDAWLERTRTALLAAGTTNVALRHVPMNPRDAEAFPQSPYLNALNEPYDLIVVDGTENWPEHVIRPTCFRRAEAHVKPGGIIVVDDSWRYPELRRSSMARRVEIFQSVGPARPGVTTTDVHFY